MIDRTRSGSRLRRRAAAGALLLASLFATQPGRATHVADELPFFAGEELGYRMRVGGLGTVAMGSMSVRGPVELRGRSVLLLTSEFEGTVPLVGGHDHTRSWIDPQRFVALRFEKSERSPMARREESVEIFPAERRWVAENGESGASPTDAPLDELSFIYFLRTLPLETGDTHRFDRHFERARNPVTVTVLGRETVEVGAGSFAAVVVEMRVRDPRRYRGEGLITLHISDDARRLPLRIESIVPGIGRTVATLEEHNRESAGRAGN